jgi:SAM-dependent methyltransferase
MAGATGTARPRWVTNMSDHRRREAEILIGNSVGPRHRNPVARLFTDPGFALRAARFALGLPAKMETEDRRVLEEVIFPYYVALPNMKSVLFVGCDWYTKHYGKIFFQHHDYWTLDVSVEARKYGDRQHIVGPLEHLDQHVPEDRFDLIVCNGVFGFGLDTPEQVERAIANCYSRLRRNGHFLFGWTDVPARVPIPLASIHGLGRFERFSFPALGTWRYVTQTPYRHTYDFYRKTDADAH